MIVGAFKVAKSWLGIKSRIRAAVRPRLARSVLDRRSALIVLAYHAIDPDPPAFMLRTGVVTRPDVFESHMRWARSRYATVALSEGVRLLRAGRLDRTSVAVTFDDGYRVTVEHGLPILIGHDIPCTFFVNGLFLDGRECWIDDVASLETAGRTDVLKDIFGPCPCGSYTRYLRREASGEVVARRTLLVQRTNGAPGRHLDEACLDELSRNPLVEIGNHSLDHPRLSLLDRDEQRRQVLANEAILSRRSHYRRLFALPFGRPEDWNLDTVAVVADSGHEFVSACGGVNFADTTGVDIRRISCDGTGGVDALEELIMTCGLGI